MSILPQLPEAFAPDTADGRRIPGAGVRDRRHGDLPSYLFTPGTVGVLSETGSLIAEVALQTTALGLGQSAVLSSSGTGYLPGGFATGIESLLNDPRTAAVVVVLSPDGPAGTETLGVFRRRGIKKPIIVHVEGTEPRKAPHLAECSSDGYRAARLAMALRAAGAIIADRPAGIGLAVQAALTAEAGPVPAAPCFVDFGTAMRQVEREVYCA